MRSRFFLLSLALIVALLAGACSSSTTVVESAERPSSPGTGITDPDPDDDAVTDPDDDAVTDLADEAEPDEDGEAVDADADTADLAEDAEAPVELDASEGFGLGGAAQIEGLLTDCEAGTDLACDILFQISGFDTIQETAALTCGGRAADSEQIFCTEGIEADGDNAYFDESSPGLDAVVSACEDDGDMTACDFLFFRSPVGSTYEEIGNTCGGRTDVALPDCRTFFAEGAE